MTDSTVLMGMFQDVDRTADVLDQLREIGIADQDITVLSSLPYSSRMLGRPSIGTGLPVISMIGTAVGFVVGLFFTIVTPNLYVIRVGGQPIVPGPPTVLLLFVLSLVMGAAGNAYSHPAIRLKSHPWSSLLAVSIFQGMGGTAVGWLAGKEDWMTLLSLKAALTMLSASIIITGYYPLTQIYQREEDRRQGDITFAVRWGERCFPLAMACMASAAVLMGALIWRYIGHWAGVVMAGGIAALVGIIALWRQRYDDSHVRANYVRMMRLGYVMAGGFLSFIGWELVGW